MKETNYSYQDKVKVGYNTSKGYACGQHSHGLVGVPLMRFQARELDAKCFVCGKTLANLVPYDEEL